MAELINSEQIFFGLLLVLSSLGVILTKKPVQASLFFLLTLLSLAALYLELSAEFIGMMQILVYAGAILVIFMFVIVLFQDAHQQIELHPERSSRALLVTAASAFSIALLFLAKELSHFYSLNDQPIEEFGTAQSLGRLIYTDFFFPFEAVTLIFLVAIVGTLYIARKEIP